MVSLKGKSVVIFGGSGFIGSHLAQRLIALGAHVTVADKLIPQNLSSRLIKKFDFKQVDISKSIGLKNVLRKKKYVFNLAAALPFSSNCDNGLKSSIDINIKGAVNIACACRDAKVKKLIFVSGYVVYGIPQYLPIDEKHPTQPVDWYGVSKLTAEKYLQVISKLDRGLELVLLRLASVYGPRQISRGLIPNLIKAAADNSSVVMNAGGKEKRDYVFVDDAVRALILSLKDGVYGTFNIGSARSVSSNRIKYIIEDLSGHPLKSKYQYKKGLIPEVRLSNSLAQRILGYKPRMSIKDGLRLTYRWYKENYANINK